jgi:hypothetical protein
MKSHELVLSQIAKDFVIAKSKADLINLNFDLYTQEYMLKATAGSYLFHKLEENSNKTVFNLNKDVLFLNMEQFNDEKQQVTCLLKLMFHELAHSTGADNRLNRPFVTNLANRNQLSAAQEELLAETVALDFWKNSKEYFYHEKWEKFSETYIRNNLNFSQIDPTFCFETFEKKVAITKEYMLDSWLGKLNLFKIK